MIMRYDEGSGAGAQASLKFSHWYDMTKDMLEIMRGGSGGAINGANYMIYGLIMLKRGDMAEARKYLDISLLKLRLEGFGSKDAGDPVVRLIGPTEELVGLVRDREGIDQKMAASLAGVLSHVNPEELKRAVPA